MITKKTTDGKSAALDLARRGFSVFPIHYMTSTGECSCGKQDCKDAGKHPMTPHGFIDGSNDPATVERLFRGSRSAANIAIATGPASGVWVLDQDGPEAMRIVEELQQQHGPLPTTVTAITGREKGRHTFWVYPAGAEIKCKNKITLPGYGEVSIDVRGEGGYAILPPSNHKSGRSYKWEHSPDDTPIAEAPSWLVDLVVGNGNSDHSNHNGNGNGKPALTFTVGGSTVEDLATAPGSPSGERHSTALRLIGSAIGRGLDLCEVARQAVEWSRRCTPPMEEDEVLKIVSDLSQTQRTKIETAIQQEVETTPLPEPIEWPVLDEAAFHGIAGEIVRKIEPESEADPVAILIQLLVMIGNLIGRLPHFVVEGTSHHANLFAVLVGSTARGRKGTSEGRVRQILNVVDEEWVSGNIKQGCVSGEGIVWNVRDEIWGLNKKGENVLLDEGISDKRLLLIEPEFAAVLRVCRRETNTLSPTLRSAWDSGILRTLAKNAPAKATDAYISIIGHITVEELRQSLTQNDSFNGFANRFLWIAVRRSKLLPDGGQDLDLDPYAERLRQIVETAQSIERMRRDSTAAALWRKAYAELADDDSTGLLAAVTSRAEAQVLRLSMIYALLDGSSTICKEHLQAALSLWRYCRQSARLIFGDASGDPLTDRILVLIRETPGISRNEIHRRISSNIKAAELVKVLAKLRDAGLVRVEKIETNGKPAEKWFPTHPTAITAITAISTQPTPNNNPLIAINAINAQQQDKNGKMEVIKI